MVFLMFVDLKFCPFVTVLTVDTSYVSWKCDKEVHCVFGLFCFVSLIGSNLQLFQVKFIWSVPSVFPI